jgi:hypothetical protein
MLVSRKKRSSCAISSSAPFWGSSDWRAARLTVVQGGWATGSVGAATGGIDQQFASRANRQVNPRGASGRGLPRGTRATTPVMLPNTVKRQ